MSLETMSFSLSQVLQSTGGKLLNQVQSTIIQGASIDTRLLKPRVAFLALEGERDGHDFLLEAEKKGASCLIVRKPPKELQTLTIPIIQVPSVEKALLDWASLAREQLSGEVIALTGSAGKSTVKSMIVSILSQKGITQASIGNFNNHLGLPLSLLSFSKEAKFHVLELGANHLGEIQFLTHFLKPSLSLVLNAGKAHVGSFGGVDKIVKAKSEILEASDATKKVIIPKDSPHFEAFYQCAQNAKPKRTILTFGRDSSSDVSLVSQKIHPKKLEMSILYGEKMLFLDLELVGAHQVLNVLAASSVALALNLEAHLVKEGLKYVTLPGSRLSLHKLENSKTQVIDDTYNGSFESFLVAFDVLSLQKKPYWLVLADMSELGKEHESLHHALLSPIQSLQPQMIWTLGKGMNSMGKKLSSLGFDCRGFDDYESLQKDFILCFKESKDEAMILIKGSRMFSLDRLFKKIQEVMSLC